MISFLNAPRKFFRIIWKSCLNGHAANVRPLIKPKKINSSCNRIKEVLTHKLNILNLPGFVLRSVVISISRVEIDIPTSVFLSFIIRRQKKKTASAVFLLYLTIFSFSGKIPSMRFYRSVTLLFIVLIIFVPFHHDNEKSNDHRSN